MAITVSAYDSLYNEGLQGNVDWANHTFKATLHLAAYAFSAAHTVYADLTDEVATGGGYFDGGLTLTGLGIAVAANIGKVDTADNINWGDYTTPADATTIVADELVVRDSTLDILLIHVNFGATQTSAAGAFEYILHANGLLRMGANGF